MCKHIGYKKAQLFSNNSIKKSLIGYQCKHNFVMYLLISEKKKNWVIGLHFRVIVCLASDQIFTDMLLEPLVHSIGDLAYLG